MKLNLKRLRDGLKGRSEYYESLARTMQDKNNDVVGIHLISVSLLLQELSTAIDYAIEDDDRG